MVRFCKLKIDFIWIGVAIMARQKRDKVPKVLLRYCNDMEHMVVHQNGILIHDGYEGFPKLTGREVLQCLAESGIIELEEEEIVDEEWS